MSLSSSSPPPQSIAEELATLKTSSSKVQILAATNAFVSAVYERTSTARVKVLLTFPPDGSYPKRPLICDVQQDAKYVPVGLKRKLDQELSQVAEKHLGSTCNQVRPVLQHLVQFVDTNLFVPCWKELRQTVDFVQQQPATSNTITMDASKGLIQVQLHSSSENSCASYFIKASIRIDPAYPATTELQRYGQPCRLTIRDSNLSHPVQDFIVQHAQAMVRCRQDGMGAKLAIQKSRPIQVPTENADETANNRHNPQQQQDQHDWKTEENSRMSQYDLPDYDGSHPLPSLLTLVTFLHQQLQHLVEAVCPHCQESVLPKDPRQLTTCVSNNSKRHQLPICGSCPCWFHTGCLDRVLRTPPFGATCPNCHQGPLHHPDWPWDKRAQREQAYAAQQAQQRALDDVADCF